MMSEHIELGESDADARWIGIRRHQAVLVIVGLGLVGDWIVRTGSVAVELALGVAALVGAARAYDGLTVGELLAIAVRYRCRSPWHTVAMVSREGSWDLHARGNVEIRGYELEHRGRLDLSGADLVGADRLCEMANGLAMAGQSSHVSVHVHATVDGARTLLTLPSGAAVCEGWRESAELVEQFVGLESHEHALDILERWSYLRTRRELLRVIRVREFAGAPSGHALLEQLQTNAAGVGVALHFDVVSAVKAHRVAARAVHRLGSDGAASRAAGFRRTAKSALSLDRSAQREELVASGHALLRVATYVSVRATSLDELRLRTTRVLRAAERSGLRVERGAGRQSSWFCHQLPGGPGW